MASKATEGTTSHALATLVIEREGLPTRYVPLITGHIRIGRDAGCELVLASQFVSRHHAEIIANADGFELVDLGSRNGTALNGRRIQANTPYVLREGDKFIIEEFSIGLIASANSEDTIARTARAADELYVDVQAMEVWIGDRLLNLRQARLLKLLAYLYEHRGRVCSEEELGNHVWAVEGAENLGVPLFDSSSLHQLIYLARRAIERTPSKPRYLRNVPGLGYRLYEHPQSED